jgi:hypothetical protein
VLYLGATPAILWGYQARFTLPSRLLWSPSPRSAPAGKPHLACCVGRPARRCPTSAVLPNVGRALNESAAVAASVPPLFAHRRCSRRVRGEASWTL